MLLLVANILEAMSIILILNMLVRKITFIHAKVMDMTCCGNTAPITTGITQTIESPWAHPPITLKTKPFESEGAYNGCNLYCFCSRSHYCVATTKIATTSQLFVTTKTRNIMWRLEAALSLILALDPVLVV